MATPEQQFAAQQAGVANASASLTSPLTPAAGTTGGAIQSVSTQAGNVISGKVGGAATKAAGSSLMDKAMDLGKSLLAGGQDQGYQAQAMPITSVGGVGMQTGTGHAQGGLGSGGGQFLSESMLAAMQAQQAKMARGF